MLRVSDILAAKGSQVVSIGPDVIVYHAVERMVQHGIGALLVMDGDAILGIFTERDHLNRVTLHDRDPRTTRVRDVMTEKLVYVSSDKTVEDCMAIMTQERIRHLPVVDDQRLAGMISIGDLVKRVSKEQEVEIRHLTDYIAGRG
jgi:CBS domain-containing protein